MTPTASRDGADTRTAILDAAERLVQTRGFNGFSYADVSSELGLTTAALHYHFAGKAELGLALITRYAERFEDALTDIENTESSAYGRLRAYAALYRNVLEADRMCLCGMLAGDYQTLQPPMRDAVTAFFDTNHRWLAHVLDAGQADGTIRFSGRTRDGAELIVGTLEGAMLVARTYGDTGRFEAVTKQLLSEFRAPRAAGGGPAAGRRSGGTARPVVRRG